MRGTAPSAAAAAATDTVAVPMEQDRPAEQQPVSEPDAIPAERQQKGVQPRMSQRGDTLLMPWIDHKGGLNALLWRQLVQRVVSIVACMPGAARWPTSYLPPLNLVLKADHFGDQKARVDTWPTSYLPLLNLVLKADHFGDQKLGVDDTCVSAVRMCKLKAPGVAADSRSFPTPDSQGCAIMLIVLSKLLSTSPNGPDQRFRNACMAATDSSNSRQMCVKYKAQIRAYVDNQFASSLSLQASGRRTSCWSCHP